MQTGWNSTLLSVCMAYSSTLKMETVCFSEYMTLHRRRWYSSKHKLPKKATNTRHKIFAAVLLKIQVFWDDVPCQLLNRCQRFYGLQHIQNVSNYRIFSNLIRTSVCWFLKQKKKKLVHNSNPHLWEDDGEDKDDSDWVTDNDSVMSDDGESDE